MAFAQLTYRESLRDIEACLSAQPTKLWHMGFRGSVRRSTLADANEARDWRIYGNSQAPPRVSPIGNNGFLFSRPRLKLRLILGFGVVAPRSGDQGTDERGEKLFAPFACIVNELEEPEIDRQLLLGNAPMGS